LLSQILFFWNEGRFQPTHTCSNWRGCQSKSPTCAQ